MDIKIKIYKYLDNNGFIKILYLFKSLFLNHSIRIDELEKKVSWLEKHSILDSTDLEDD